jgi:hypothetical protein
VLSELIDRETVMTLLVPWAKQRDQANEPRRTIRWPIRYSDPGWPGGGLFRPISQGGVSCPSHPPSDFGEPFDAAAVRLRAAVSDACARPRPWPARVAAAIYAALDFAVEDPAAARLLLIEPWAHGEAGTARRQRLLDRFAALLAAERPAPPDGGRLPAAGEQLTPPCSIPLTERSLSPLKCQGPIRGPILSRTQVTWEQPKPLWRAKWV